MLTADQIISMLKLKDDRMFVRNKLKKYDPFHHDRIVNGYMDQWRIGVNSVEIEYKKQNAGRYMANCWLRDENHNV